MGDGYQKQTTLDCSSGEPWSIGSLGLIDRSWYFRAAAGADNKKHPAVTAPATNTSATPQTPREKARGILREGLQDDSGSRAKGKGSKTASARPS
jgi:hypothetical protein